MLDVDRKFASFEAFSGRVRETFIVERLMFHCSASLKRHAEVQIAV